MDWIQRFGRHIRLWWRSGLQPTFSYQPNFENNALSGAANSKPEHLPEKAAQEPFVRPFDEEFLPAPVATVIIEIMPAANQAHMLAWRVALDRDLEHLQPDGYTVAKACLATYKELKAYYAEEDDDYGL